MAILLWTKTAFLSVFVAGKRFPVKSGEPIVMFTGFKGFEPRFNAVYRISLSLDYLEHLGAPVGTLRKNKKKLRVFWVLGCQKLHNA